MRSVADALRAVVDAMPRLPPETVALEAALGRVLVDDIVAMRASPGFDNSAMDGYAVRARELPAMLPLAGVIGAGDEPAALPPGHAARIFTGAPMPLGADTVIMQEETQRDGDRVVLPAARLGDNVRRAGEDIAIGERVLAAGTRLRPWDLGVLAALGCARVEVTRAPRVALVATGDELVEVAEPPAYGQ
ncbi:MAG TPA: molybdopterin molybdotransferase MoeA, partial [Kofleriaceae bacterium]|nr:molybdopterin molybdotransferase MoeA [Kofleriaceae bacterium]